jgi:hypothetical protein
MAVSDIDGLREQMPELFEDYGLPSGWEDDWVYIPVDRPEAPDSLDDVFVEQMERGCPAARNASSQSASRAVVTRGFRERVSRFSSSMIPSVNSCIRHEF